MIRRTTGGRDVTITPLADTPSVTNAVTNEDTLSMSGLVILPLPQDGVETSHFQMTNITNGTLFLNDGVTQINNGDFITTADGAMGLKLCLTQTFSVMEASIFKELSIRECQRTGGSENHGQHHGEPDC